MSKSSPGDDYFKLTEHRLRFLGKIRSAFSKAISSRYRAGQEEHGGDLWLKGAYPMLGAELVDAYTYYRTHRDRMRHWLNLLEKAHHGAYYPKDTIDLVMQEIRVELGTETSAETLSPIDDGVLYNAPDS